jgi:hypothetical protein
MLSSRCRGVRIPAKARGVRIQIQSSEVHMLVLMTPGGFMNASATMTIPAQSLDIPADDGITYATVDLPETIKVFAKYGVRFLAPDEIALELPAFLLCPST